MSDPPRLLDGGASDLERSLLSSWDAERPSAEARERALAIAGMGTVTLAAAAKGAAGGSLAPKAAVGLTSAAKWLLFAGASAVAVGGAAVAYLRVSDSHVARTPVAVVASAPSVAPPSSPSPVASPAPEPSVAAPAPVVAPMAPTAHGAPTRGSAAPRPASTLGEQVTALDHARRALADGDPRAAIRALDDYEARYPRGVLGEEAEVVRIEALVAAGDRDAAARTGARFLAAHPASPHAARVRALLGDP